MRVYLSGPITSIGEEASRLLFEEGEKQVLNKGLTPVNPWDFPPGKCGSDCDPTETDIFKQHSWRCWMIGDIKELILCEGIAMLPGWKDSRGAKLEYHIAAKLEMSIILLSGS